MDQNKAANVETSVKTSLDIQELWSQYGQLQAEREKIALCMQENQNVLNRLTQEMSKIYSKIPQG